jgi:hypothetical protein
MNHLLPGERMDLDVTTVKPGDPVTYVQTCRGGYGFTRDVPAVFVRAGVKRHTIRVRSSDGSREVEIHVAPGNLRVADPQPLTSTGEQKTS